MNSSEPRVGCGAAIIKEGKILLLQRLTQPEAGSWGLPGGKVDLYETAARATQREVMEEIGIGIEALDLLCLVEQIDATQGQHWVAPVYLVTSFTDRPAIAEPNKHGGLAWWPIDQPPNPLPTLRLLHCRVGVTGQGAAEV